MKGRWVLWGVAVSAAVLLSSVAAVSSRAQSGSCEYFPETGHYVCDEFLQAFEARGALEIFGYPLTEAFEDTRQQLQVQYFQRVRMEFHPYNPDPYKVQLGLLVDELNYSYPKASPEQIPAFDSNLHHYFPETGHVVSYAFLDYFREKGGLDIFGYPRSEFMYEDGYIVQYFQRARMEWHPENHSGPQMQLTNLGEMYIERFGVPPGVEDPLLPAFGGDAPSSEPQKPRVTRLNISASVRNVITGREGVQTVFVYVTDQLQEPVQGAAVSALVHYQSGDESVDFAPTNASGFTSAIFEILPSTPGRRVVIDVTVTYIDGPSNTILTDTTQTFFLPWW
jgi:hypothetical protein